jgi:hypothetical protein
VHPDSGGDLLERQLRQASTELGRRLRAGQDSRAEDLFKEYPALAAAPDRALDLILTEFDTREDLGQSPSRDVFYQRFPQWRDDLKRLFADIDKEDFKDKRGLEDYEPLEEIGRGPMGEVWRARQISLGREVALKMFPGGNHDDLERFRRGAEDQARLKHANIVPVYEVGEAVPFIAMELGEGGGLDRKLAGRPQPPAEAARCVETLARAMHYAHGQGIIHRDLKPANVVLTKDGVPKITDFGLAKRLEATTGPTQSGALLGTLPYMAPEQVSGKSAAVDRRTDVYALGAILYEMLTGRVPFQAKGALELLQQVQKRNPMRLRRIAPRVDRRLESICLQCLEKKPRWRYRTAEQLADDLGRWINGRGPVADGLVAHLGRFVRRHSKVSAAALLLACVAAIVSLVLYVKHPNRKQEQIERRLAAREEVTLIGEIGPPQWFRWATIEEGQRDFVAVDGSFSVQSSRLGLLEIVHNPHCARFRVSAEVRHNDAASQISEVGIYFGYSKHVTQHGVEHCLCSVGFNGLMDLRKSSPTLKGNPVRLDVRRIIEPRVNSFSFPASSSGFLPVSEKEGRVWRKMAVEVSPETIRFTVQGETMEAARAGLDNGKLELCKPKNRVAAGPGFLPPLEDDPGLAPQSPFGLFVHRGIASFRNVVVTPLPNTN